MAVTHVRATVSCGYLDSGNTVALPCVTAMLTTVRGHADSGVTVEMTVFILSS